VEGDHVTELAGPPQKMVISWKAPSPRAKESPEQVTAGLRVIDGDLALPAPERSPSFEKAT
jgi:hypothetical protein